MSERRARVMRGGAWLRRQRLARDLTQIQLAGRIGVDQAKLSAYETGRYEIDVLVARRIADALGLSELAVWQGLELPLPREVVSDEAAIAWARERYPGEIERLTGQPAPEEPPRKTDTERQTGPRRITHQDDDGRSASQG